VSDTETVYNINVNALAGDDYIDIFGVEVESVIALAGDGNDDVFIGLGETPSYFYEDLIVVAGDGDDQVIVGDASASDTSLDVYDDLIVNAGDGTDLIDVAYYDVGADVVLDAGPGDDVGYESQTPGTAEADFSGGVLMFDMDIDGNLHVFLGNGSDLAEIEDVSVGNNAFIDAGADDDHESLDFPNGNAGYAFGGVNIFGLDVGNNFWLNLGSGYDTAYVSDLLVDNNAYFNAGGDDDELVLENVDIFNNLHVQMGGGDDTLSIDGSFANEAWLFGDGGNEDLYVEGFNSFGSENVYSFEYFA
jgi:hypothetical protein